MREALFYFPVAAFGWTDALDDAIGFEVGEMLFYRFGRYANLFGKCNSAQLAIFRKHCNDFLPTFCEFLPTFLSFLPTFCGFLPTF